MRLLLVLGLTTVLTVPAFAQPTWEVVTSKEGGFSVEMPATPTIQKTRTRKGADGTTKVTLLGGKSDNALYLVYKIELPTAIVKGTEDKQLDVERDAFAEEYNGKVITEKKVLAAGKLGRDFTIRGRPAEETGTLTIRIREYLDGKVVYAVLVASAPNRELPEGVGRFLGSLVLGDGKLRPTAPQEPEPKGTELKGWGLAIDPDNDCKFTPAEKGLTINVPGTMHDFGGPLKKFNAPRVMREVEEDFVLTVKVAGELKPGPKSTNPKGIPYLGTGLLIWSDSANFIRLERAALLRAGKVVPQVAFLEQEGGYGGAVHNESFPAGGDCYLRLERKGSRIHGAASSDGSTWKQLKPIDTVWQSKLRVGLSVISTSSEPFTVKFEDFGLQTKEKK
jgi:regulation of enolase protein 1 (concanavalin A-like superfamily)